MFGDNKEYNLLKLSVGTTFKLLGSRWEILEIGEYNWKMSTTSIEYTIKSGDNKAYLEVELCKGDYEVVFTESLFVDESILIEALASKELEVGGKLFELDETYQGDYKNLTTSTTRENLECYIFYAEDDQQITIEKWQDASYEAFIGNEVKSKKIKNIK